MNQTIIKILLITTLCLIQFCRSKEWTVLVKIANTSYFCTGVLVSDRHVITARHCLAGGDLEVKFLNVKEISDKQFKVLNSFYPSENLEIGEEYNLKLQSYKWRKGYSIDIAILEIEPIIGIEPINLPNRENNYTKETHVVNGFGGMFPLGCPLTEYEVTLKNGKECYKDYLKKSVFKIFLDLFESNALPLEDLPYLEPNFYPYICSTMHSVRKGDSGGPIMLEVSRNEWILIGIGSHATHHKKVDEMIDYHVSVIEMLPWIESIINT